MRTLTTMAAVAQAHILGLALLQPEVQEPALAMVLFIEQTVILLFFLTALLILWRTTMPQHNQAQAQALRLASVNLDHANHIRRRLWARENHAQDESAMARLVHNALGFMMMEPTTEDPGEAWAQICAEHPGADEHAVWTQLTPKPLRCPPIEEVYVASGWTP